MFEVVVVVLERGTGIVRRIDVDAFDLSGVFRLKGLEREEVVAMDEHVPCVGVQGCV